MNNENYMNITSDMSGSRSKNRFRNEMLWGLSKIFETYTQQEDFVVVFDYVCDIELHYGNTVNFYQMKTDKQAATFTISRLTKRNDDEKSILGQLFLIKTEAENGGYNTSVAVVSNIPLKAKQTYSSDDCVCMGKLDNGSRKEIIDRLSSEFDTTVDTNNLENFYYILSSLDLFNPQDTMLGKTVKFYTDVIGEEPSKPQTLFNTLEQTVKDCACYEKNIGSYEDLIKNKGITKQKIDSILKQYSSLANDSVGKCKEFIDQLYKDDYSACIRMRRALDQVVVDLQTSSKFQSIEKKVASFVLENISKYSGSKENVVDQIIAELNDWFSVEYSHSERWVLILLVLTRIEEGVYEKFDSK